MLAGRHPLDAAPRPKPESADLQGSHPARSRVNADPPAEFRDGDGASLHGPTLAVSTCRPASTAFRPHRIAPMRFRPPGGCRLSTRPEEQLRTRSNPSRRASRTNRHPPCERTCGRTSWSRFLARRLPVSRRAPLRSRPRGAAGPVFQGGENPTRGFGLQALACGERHGPGTLQRQPRREARPACVGRVTAEVLRRGSRCDSFSGAPATPPKGLRPDPR
jgi:hypothetical protein